MSGSAVGCAQSDRILYAPNGDKPIPVVMVRRGRWRSLVASFEPFRGVKMHRVWTRDLYEGDLAEQIWAFRQDPLAAYGGREDPAA
jgi:hypothetical protein